DFPAMADAERLAAAESDVGDAGVDDAPGKVERLGAIELITPGAVGAGFFAASDAACATTVGQLPGKKKGRAVVVYGAPRLDILSRQSDPVSGVDHGVDGLVSISGEADVGLGHHLLGDVFHLRGFPVELPTRIDFLDFRVLFALFVL